VAVALVILDHRLSKTGNVWWTYAGAPRNASDALTTIASSMITFTGLVFSITVVALQLTTSQFSPRALRNFLRDRLSQFALGVFVATFAFAFVALTAVRAASADDAGFVPALTTTGALVLVATSVVMFIEFIHHTAQSLRAVSIVEAIAVETRSAVDRLYPADGTESVRPMPLGPVHAVAARRSGIITDVDLDGLAGRGAEENVLAEVVQPVGTYVCEGMPLLRLHGPVLGDDGGWARFVNLGTEPTMRQDAAFGLRQLVDIAERALSPGTNDPSTAVQCLDRIHDVLRRLSTRAVPAFRVGADPDGQVRAWIPAPSYEALVHLALDEVRHWGAGSLQVHTKLESILEDLLTVTHEPLRRSVLHDQQRLLADRRSALPEPERLRVRAPRV
jgi:uncharacterized membrane protein